MAGAEFAKVRFIVRGRVQGVGFRRFVYKHARALALSGWVCNRSDGGVEVEACGSAAILNDFVEIVRKGSFISRVDELEIVSREPSVEERALEFEIRH